MTFYVHYAQPIMIVPESLEPPQLLNLLGIERIHPSSNKHPTHMLPLVFACEVSKGVVTFTQLQQPVTKKILKPEKCYLLSYKDMVCLIHNSIADSHSYTIFNLIYYSEFTFRSLVFPVDLKLCKQN